MFLFGRKKVNSVNLENLMNALFVINELKDKDFKEIEKKVKEILWKLVS